jgi:EAL domain-containing protein (putative c-di-GMP-specific phosphodiesterase class I)
LRETLRDLKRMGFSMALAGGGSASLEILAELAPDYLMIGRELLHQIDEGGVRYRLLQSLTHMAADAGAKAIAETIDTEAQRQTCIALNIPLGQGALFGRPHPWAELRSPEINRSES